MISFFGGRGYDVFNAHKREKYGRALLPPETCTKEDYNEMKSCDMVIAYPGNPPSGGTHIELGWASMLGKRIILLLKEGGDYSPLVQGLYSISNVEYVRFKNYSELIQKLEKMF